MTGMSSVPVHLILGDDEFLAERARLSVQHGEVTKLKASEVSEGEILEATSPSLFGDERCIVISDVEKAGKEVTRILLDACVSPMRVLPWCCCTP